MKYATKDKDWTKHKKFCKLIGLDLETKAEWKKWCDAHNRIGDLFDEFWPACKALGDYWRKITSRRKAERTEDTILQLQKLQDRIKAILVEIGTVGDKLGHRGIGSETSQRAAVILSLCYSMKCTGQLSCFREAVSMLPSLMDMAGERKWGAYMKRCKKWNDYWK